MTDQTLHCREAFEKWLREEVFKNFSSTNGQEEERLSRLHWPTWQAAWNTRSNAQGGYDAAYWKDCAHRAEDYIVTLPIMESACPKCAECAEYLKEGETPKERIERERKDVRGVLNVLRIERERNDIQRLVDRFLAWPLPDSVCPDVKYPAGQWREQYGHPLVGTHLLTAADATAMFEHVLNIDDLYNELSVQRGEKG